MALSEYRGRFAPSPTGLLHAGSLVTAIGSYLEARVHHGAWLLRIEDIDPPREMPGASDAIIRTLEALGFEWEGSIVWQHTRLAAYEAALEALRESGWVYGCECTRRQIAQFARQGVEAWVYPQTCRHKHLSVERVRAWRLRIPDGEVSFEDAVQGRVTQNVADAVGDVVLRRADGLFAYQLAVVVDDAWQRVTHVVRGADLLLSTPRQICVQRALGVATPQYAHLPLLVNAAGEKLSKQTLAPPLNPNYPVETLRWGLSLLGLDAPDDADTVAALWQWAIEVWRLERVSPHTFVPSLPPN